MIDLKNRKVMKMLISFILVLTCVSTPIIIYFGTWHASSKVAKKIDLDYEELEYWAEVWYMNNINATEATTITNDLKTEIARKMKSLNLVENTDYIISRNIDDFKEGSNLGDFIGEIVIASVETSIKATGQLFVGLRVQENINNRNPDALSIPENEAKGLSKGTADILKFTIGVSVRSILNKGQANKENVDYIFINLDWLEEGAEFEDYHDQIKVRGISRKLTGEFLINFVIKS